MSLITTDHFQLAVNAQGNPDAERIALFLPGKLDTKDHPHMRSHVEFFAAKGIPNTFITLGEKGAFFINAQKNIELEIPIPQLASGVAADETGCGDQTMAAFIAAVAEGKDVVTSAKEAVVAGTLQYYKPGVDPVTKEELRAALSSL